MNSLILNTETAKLSLEDLLGQLGNGGVEVKDFEGRVIAVIVGPIDKEALTYAEANIDIDRNIEQVRRALGRRGGITTSQLLAKAKAAAAALETPQQ
jgi:hypothetical protein